MICHFACSFPKVVGEFLDRASGLNRSFREETVTDVLMGAMVAFRPFGIEVIFSDEPNTGADMEWMFERSDGSSRFCFLIQAKKLYGQGKVWKRRSYPEIFHVVKKSGILQSASLVSSAKVLPATFPLYILYTHQSVCDMAAQAGQVVEGVSLVSGDFINDLVNRKVAGSIRANEASSLGIIQPNMFPLSRLLCSLVVPRPAETNIPFLVLFSDGGLQFQTLTVPTPEEVRARLARISHTSLLSWLMSWG